MSRRAPPVDASALLFQREPTGVQPASVARVTSAAWDPVFVDCVGVCDEQGMFQYIDCTADERVDEQFFRVLALGHDARVRKGNGQFLHFLSLLTRALHFFHYHVLPAGSRTSAPGAARLGAI